MTVREMKAFVGLCFAMGVLRLPSRNDYWRQTKWFLKTEFGKVMSRDRFNLIWRYLHLTNNAIPAAIGDKLSKVRWYIDFLNNQFQTVYVPYGKYAVDESMIRFKGRLAFRQYMPAKPIKWGVKVWALAESSTQGSYGCLKTLKVLEFEMCKIKPLKVLDFIPESLKVLGFHLLEIYV